MFFTDVGNSDHAVWTKRTKSRFVHRVFVMYHATRPENASQIIAQGGRFRCSTTNYVRVLTLYN